MGFEPTDEGFAALCRPSREIRQNAQKSVPKTQRNGCADCVATPQVRLRGDLGGVLGQNGIEGDKNQVKTLMSTVYGPAISWPQRRISESSSALD